MQAVIPPEPAHLLCRPQHELGLEEPEGALAVAQPQQHVAGRAPGLWHGLQGNSVPFGEAAEFNGDVLAANVLQ
jgi:hypothetical protein